MGMNGLPWLGGLGRNFFATLTMTVAFGPTLEKLVGSRIRLLVFADAPGLFAKVGPHAANTPAGKELELKFTVSVPVKLVICTCVVFPSPDASGPVSQEPEQIVPFWSTLNVPLVAES